MRTGKRRVKSGHFYNRFFDQAKGKNITVKKEATLRDTMKWIKIVVEKFQHQSKKIARHLKARRVRQTCFNIWKFCFEHFQYEKDEKRKEQIRTPYRSWHDRHSYKNGIKSGIDCDCFSTFIATCLLQLGIPFVFRLTRYEKDDFEHIYPVAFDENGEEIIMDAVVHSFDYEMPYTEKLDEEMELQILNGIGGQQPDEDRFLNNDLPIDAQDLFLNEDMELDGLDGKAEREARRRKRKEKRAKRRETPIKERLKKGLNKINKLNPAAALLRAGILASMKLNLFKVASGLRFAYWSDGQARQNSVDLNKFNQLKRVREKLEKIFFRAGGKTENLRKAMLTGRGNRNKMVALNGFGLGSIGVLPTDYDDLKTILGEDMYFDEIDGSEGLNGLGEIATGAAVAAASGTMGILAGLLKKIGNIFKKGSNAAKKFKDQDSADDSEEKKRRFSIRNIVNKVRNKVQERRARKRGTELPEPKQENNEVITFDDDQEFNVPEEDFEITPEDEYDFSPDRQTRQPTVTDQEQPTDTANSTEQTDKKPNAVIAWIKENQGLSWGIGGLTALGLGYLGYRALTKKKDKPKKAASGGINGVSRKKKSRTKKKPTSRKRRTKTRKTSSTRTRTNSRKKTRTSTRKPTTRLKEISLK